MKLSEAAERAIELATAIDGYWEAELPKRHKDYPLVAPGEDSGPPPPEEAELRSLLESLSDEELYELLLVMHLGRGDFGTNDLATNFEILKDRYPQRQWAAAQLEKQASAADYLADGVAELRSKGIDMNRWKFASARAGS